MSNLDNLIALLLQQTVGFDNVVRSARSSTGPAYNIIEKEDDKFTIEVAVAGYDPKNLNLTVEENVLHIKYDKGDGVNCADIDDQPKLRYHRKDISTRNFWIKIPLGERIQVVDADIQNGMLTVDLERIVPEHLKPKEIPIKSLAALEHKT